MLAFVVSCSQKNTQTEGEVCMTIKSEESPVTMSVSSAPQPTEQAPETDTIVVIQETVTVPEAYSKFKSFMLVGGKNYDLETWMTDGGYDSYKEIMGRDR